MIIRSSGKNRQQQLWSSPSCHHRFLYNIDPSSAIATSFSSSNRGWDAHHWPNVACTNSYKSKLGWFGSSGCLACRCSQTIENNCYSCAVYFKEQQNLKNILKLLSKAEYGVVKVHVWTECNSLKINAHKIKAILFWPNIDPLARQISLLWILKILTIWTLYNF